MEIESDNKESHGRSLHTCRAMMKHSKKDHPLFPWCTHCSHGAVVVVGWHDGRWWCSVVGEEEEGDDVALIWKLVLTW